MFLLNFNILQIFFSFEPKIISKLFLNTIGVTLPENQINAFRSFFDVLLYHMDRTTNVVSIVQKLI